MKTSVKQLDEILTRSCTTINILDKLQALQALDAVCLNPWHSVTCIR